MLLFTTIMMQHIYNRAKKDKKRIINELCFIILHISVKKMDNIVKKLDGREQWQRRAPRLYHRRTHFIFSLPS